MPGGAGGGGSQHWQEIGDEGVTREQEVSVEVGNASISLIRQPGAVSQICVIFERKSL